MILKTSKNFNSKSKKLHNKTKKYITLTRIINKNKCQVFYVCVNIKRCFFTNIYNIIFKIQKKIKHTIQKKIIINICIG